MSWYKRKDFLTILFLLFVADFIWVIAILHPLIKNNFMAAVRDILKSKGKNVFAVTPKTTVYSALEMMVEKNVSSLMVTENEKLIGIFTERDYARKVILKGKSSRETPIEDIMTGKLITVSSSTTVDECMQLMSSNFIRHLPVVDNDVIVGLVSIGDLVRHIIEEQKFIIENMGNYIAGA